MTCLADLFHSIATQKKKVGVIPPKKFISRLRKENGKQKTGTLLDSNMLISINKRGFKAQCGHINQMFRLVL